MRVVSSSRLASSRLASGASSLSLVALALALPACGSDELLSATGYDPPADSYDPSDGFPSSGTGTGTGGPGSGNDSSNDGNDDAPPPPPPQEGAWDWRDAVIYFVFVDRFNNGDPSNDGMIDGVVADIADWNGGDWQGVIDRIDEGYFNELGVNTLWVTVPMDNTSEAGQGVADTRMYSAYHGYWPSNLEATEEHFGTLDELKELVTVAHDHELKVIFDYAMNHVHIGSPVYGDNPEWFWPNDNGFGGNCVCGQGCSWDGDEGKRCWFTGYLPDFDFTNAQARAASIDNALWWAQQTGADGFRLDAVKHIDDAWLLDLRERSNAELDRYDDASGELVQRFYMVGETFTGDQGQIAYYVRDEMLDGQFDFPLRTKIVENVLMRQGAMSDLAGFMDGNDGVYWSGAVMSTFIGNHDLPRVVHYAQDVPLAGNNPWWNDQQLGWDDPPGVPAGTSAFERLVVGFGIILTTPGAPLVYYGDEIGMAGAGDPDNRRFMDWNTGGYTAGQQLVLDGIKTLTTIRAAHPALRYGTRTSLASNQDTFSYRMQLSGAGELDETVFVAINRADGANDVGGLPDGSYLDEMTGDMVTVSGGVVSVPARWLRVLVPQ